MKAFYSIAYGGRGASVYGDLPDPVLCDDQLLIEVKAVSINPVDFKVKNGDVKIITGFKFPKIVGTDFAGIVRKTGRSTQCFKPGDSVYGSSSVIFRNPGALSELLAVNYKKVRLKPEGMSFEEAASLPVAALTALNGLRKTGVSAGKHVLINGATGGVGHFAVQIAKSKGAVVTATCSKRNADLAKKLGADDAIGYSDEELTGTNVKYDSIFDAYGEMGYKVIVRLLKRRGIYASTLFFVRLSFISVFARLFTGRVMTSSNMRSRKQDFEEIEKLFRESKLRPLIENTFTLDKAADAFELAESGKSRGKIIITV